MANEKTAISAIKKEAEQLNWGKFQFASDTLKTAVKTVQGIPFSISSDYTLCVMCDEADGFYTEAELIGCVKKYGNYSDFQDSRKIIDLVDDELVSEDIETVMSVIKSGAFVKTLTAKAQTQCANVDWGTVAEELKPYILAVQKFNITKTIMGG